VAGLFKAVQGLFMTSQHMIATGRGADEVVSVDELLAHTEDHGILLAPEGDRACSAPHAMLKEFVTVALDGPPAARAIDRSMADLVDDPDAFFQYGELAVTMLLATQLFKAQLRIAADALCRQAELPGAAPPALDAELRGLLDELTRRQDGLPLEHGRRLVGEIAELLEDGLGECGIGGARSRFLALAPWGEAADATALAAWLRDHAVEVAPGVAACIVDALALERDALRYFARIQARVGEVLGDDRPVQLDGADLATVFPTVGAAIAARLAITIRHDAGTTLARGGRTHTLRAEAEPPVGPPRSP
jgi:hypothetical protein